MDHSTTNAADLAAPLLSQDEQEQPVIVVATEEEDGCVQAATEWGSCCSNNHHGDHSPPTTTTTDESSPSEFSYQNELMEMMNLGIPLAVSFFCRMVRKQVGVSRLVWSCLFPCLVVSCCLHFSLSNQPTSPILSLFIYSREWPRRTRPLSVTFTTVRIRPKPTWPPRS